jgi:membrane protease YdiL (CAAX protease family)
LNIIPPYRALIFDFILFLSFGGLIWTINIIGHSTFPGNNLFPFLIRSAILLLLLAFTYYANYKFSRKNLLNFDILKFKPRFIKYYLGGILLGCLLIAAIWAIIYVIYPFEIIKNPYSKINVANDVIFYSLGNTFEELLFRGFVLLASVKLFGKMGGVFFVSLLFGLFHLQGTGLTSEGLSMIMTTFTMSLVLISVIYYTKSIWTAATLHITGNLLLHTLGFDGTNNGIFQINFTTSNINRDYITLIYETVVIIFALLLYSMAKKNINCC